MKASKHSLAANLREMSSEPVLRDKPPGGSFATKKKADPAPTDAARTLEPHVCRYCFGRLASLIGPDGLPSVECTNCGAVIAGPVSNLCACGVKIRRDGPAGPRWVDAGLRCKPNPGPTPEFPSVFVAIAAQPDC